MITLPSSSRAVDVVRQALREMSEQLDNPDLRTRLTMLDSILHGVGVRSEFEIQWMLEEISEIEQMSKRLAESTTLPSDLQHALSQLERVRHRDLRASEVQKEYDAASAVLSLLLEFVLKAEHPLRPSVESLVSRRVDREAEILGPFSLAGRT